MIVLSIKWEVAGLPSLVGPFDTEDEAVRWAGMNIPNGSWDVFVLASPFSDRRAMILTDDAMRAQREARG